MEEIKIEKDVLRCPKCKAEIEVDVSHKGIIFNRKKILTYYCPLCDFENKKEFKLNETQYKKEVK